MQAAIREGDVLLGLPSTGFLEVGPGRVLTGLLKRTLDGARGHVRLFANISAIVEFLPNLLPIVASSFLFTVLYGVGTYTALAFLGLVNPNHWSWGGMLFVFSL